MACSNLLPDRRDRGLGGAHGYVLSMTAEAGYAVPDAALLGADDPAMKAVVDGRLERDTKWSGRCPVDRIAALAALARNGASTAAMLGANSNLAPADMPTSA